MLTEGLYNQVDEYVSIPPSYIGAGCAQRKTFVHSLALSISSLLPS